MKKFLIVFVFALTFALGTDVNAQSYSASAEDGDLEWLDPNKLDHSSDLDKMGNFVFEQSGGTEILVHAFKGKTHYVGFAVSLDGSKVFKYSVKKNLSLESLSREETTEEKADIFLKRMASN
ncbi:hypothetical protein KC929_02325 [Patescibacteria group bacterium]|nr:hypothetical protein [Patescibacteria group bacterium]